MSFRNPITSLAELDGTIRADQITGQLTASQILSVAAGQVTGQLTDAQIAAISALKIAGQITDTQIASVAAGAVTGKLTAGQIVSLAANQVTGQLTDAQLSAISAAKVTGQLAAGQIASVGANQVTGQLTDAQLSAISAAKVTGQLSAAQIASVAAVAITGQLTAAQILSLAANQITGQLTASQIAAVSAAAITGQLAGTQLAADSIDGKTITGATVRTAPSGNRVELAGSTNKDRVSFYSGLAEETNPAYVQLLPGSSHTGTTWQVVPPGAGAVPNPHLSIREHYVAVGDPAGAGVLHFYADPSFGATFHIGARDVPIEDTGWVDVSALSAGYTQGGTTPIKCRRLNGVVYMTGFVQRTAGGGSLTTAFTLPAGFTPAVLTGISLSSNTTTTMMAQVQPSGAVNMWTSAAITNWIPLASIIFPVG